MQSSKSYFLNLCLGVILHKINYSVRKYVDELGGSQRSNVEGPIFQNCENKIKIKKDELFDNFIIKLFFSFFRNYLNTQNL